MPAGVLGKVLWKWWDWLELWRKIEVDQPEMTVKEIQGKNIRQIHVIENLLQEVLFFTPLFKKVGQHLPTQTCSLSSHSLSAKLVTSLHVDYWSIKSKTSKLVQDQEFKCVYQRYMQLNSFSLSNWPWGLIWEGGWKCKLHLATESFRKIGPSRREYPIHLFSDPCMSCGKITFLIKFFTSPFVQRALAGFLLSHACVLSGSVVSDSLWPHAL